MSGRKYTTIAINELERLRKQANNATFLENSVATLRRLNNDTMTYLNQQNTRISHLNNTIRTLSTDLSNQSAAISRERQQMRTQIANIVRNTDNAINEMNRRYRDDLTAINSAFRRDLEQQREETVRMIEVSNAHLTNALNSAVSELEEGINTVSSRVDHVERQVEENARTLGMIINSDAALAEFAREFAESAAVTNNNTANNYRTELLLPGRLEQAQNLLETAQREIADLDKYPTNAPVARRDARTALVAALQLHQDIAIAEQEWQSRLFEAQRSLATARAQIETASSVKFPEDDDCVVDVDRWSNGGLTALTQRADAIEDVLKQPEALTVESLDELNDAAGQLITEAQRTAEFAVIAMAASQDRADSAEDLYENLRELLGLEVQADGYEGGDDRSGYRLHLKNPLTGFEMVITQTPQINEDGSICNLLETDILDFGNNNEKEGARVALSALEMLRENGYDLLSAIQTRSGFENRASDRPEVANLQGWVSRNDPTVPCVPAPNYEPLPDAAVAHNGNVPGNNPAVGVN